MRNSNTMPLTKRPRHKQKILSIDTLMAVLKEFISTFIFVFTATGSRITINKLTGDEAALGLLATAIAHAFALSVAVYAALYIGAARKITVNPPGPPGPPRYTFRNPFDNPYTLCGHINPAVTFGAFIGGNLHIFRGLIYWIVQLLASICACLLLMFIFGRKNVPVFDLSNGVRVQNAIVLEMVMTFGLVFTMCATVFDPKGKGYNKPINIVINGQNVQRLVHMRPLNKFAPLAIGFIVGANILVGGPFDGASMNPALSFGPAVVTWRWSNHWVYWVGPLIGGGLASFFYDFVFITK